MHIKTSLYLIEISTFGYLVYGIYLFTKAIIHTVSDYLSYQLALENGDKCVNQLSVKTVTP